MNASLSLPSGLAISHSHSAVHGTAPLVLPTLRLSRMHHPGIVRRAYIYTTFQMTRQRRHRYGCKTLPTYILLKHDEKQLRKRAMDE